MYLPKDALLPAVFFPCPGRGAGELCGMKPCAGCGAQGAVFRSCAGCGHRLWCSGAVRDEAGDEAVCGMKPCTGCGVPAEPLDGGAAQGEGARAASPAGVWRKTCAFGRS